MIWFVFLAAAGLAAGQPNFAVDSPSQTATERSSDVRSDVCYALATAPAYPMKISDCVIVARAADTEFASAVCSFLRQTGQLEDFGYRAFKDCVESGFR